MTDPRYPIGPESRDDEPTEAKRQLWSSRIANLPDALEAAVAELTGAQLDTPYREGGWTVRQVVHHIADSHLNAYCRFRLTLTEDSPTVRPYDEKAWALLPDAASGPIEPSLALIRGLHTRWASLLSTLSLSDYDRPLHHPENGDLTLWNLLGSYDWHCRHHVAHITALAEREGWRG
ncbi:MAG: putative metal-dependent hydrolase [Rhodothermales bacterium]|nr:putative metal-dependent hydrolase [Rhodothermales bacterium]